jgi:hypothetical protein
VKQTLKQKQANKRRTGRPPQWKVKKQNDATLDLARSLVLASLKLGHTNHEIAKQLQWCFRGRHVDYDAIHRWVKFYKLETQLTQANKT